MTELSGFETFVKRVSDIIKEASELQVLTFSGEISSYITPDGKDLKWGDFFTEAAKKTGGTLILVAATQVQIDGDTILFISNSPEIDGPLKQAHMDATVAAQKYRTELVLGLANIIGIKLKTI
jgi:hypothetical protein